jgi:hypothetical protein
LGGLAVGTIIGGALAQPYYGSYYGSPYGYYGSPYGWYNGYYYPGTGYYVYDRDRNRRVMTTAERQHWREVMGRLAGSTTTATAKTATVAPRENWSGFNRRSQARSSEWQAAREQRVQSRQEMRTERAQARSERFQTRMERRSSNRGRHSDNGSDD